MAGLGKHWKKISKSYKIIPEIYESTNRLISLNQMNSWREDTARNLLKSLEKQEEYLILDAGSGPGNMLDTLEKVSSNSKIEGVMFDFSVEMMKSSNKHRDSVQGIYEYMPFRKNSFDGVIMGFAMHAAIDADKASSELSRISKKSIGIVSAGKSKSRIKRDANLFYMQHIVPKIAIITAGKKAKEFKTLYKIYLHIPTNKELLKILSKHFEPIIFKEIMLGSVYEFIGTKRKKGNN